MIPRGAAGVPEPPGGVCSLACGAGTCVLDPSGAPHCRCPALFAGERCQHYRCAQHCHRRGRCELDVSAPPQPGDAPPPLKVLRRSLATLCMYSTVHFDDTYIVIYKTRWPSDRQLVSICNSVCANKC